TITVASEVAGWDPAVTERLVAQPLRHLLDPRDALSAIAAERGWLDSRLARDAWHLGAVDEIDGESRIHPALLVVSDPGRELERRLWTAQTTVLLPVVERRRRDILVRLDRTIRRALPFST